jgi:predicted phosphodiesterase
VIQRFTQFIFRKPLLWLLSKFGGAPVKEKVQQKLSSLYKNINNGNKKIGPILNISPETDKLVIMSDLHKGNGNAADDFRTAQNNYMAACYYYLQNDFTYIALGDIEELWENNIAEVVANNENSIEVERKFVEKNKFYKIIGNHDLYWSNTPFFAHKWLKKMYDKVIPIYEGMLLKTKIGTKKIDIFLTHGHQGDKTSDGNKLSKWFVANVWSKVQAYLDINLNTPSQDFLLRDKHNRMMYEWSKDQKELILITGHTHKPVFASLNHIEKLNKDLAYAKDANEELLAEKIMVEIAKRKQEYISTEPFTLKKPSYFNTGCCCFNDGDITVIEIADLKIKLVKWCESNGDINPIVLQEIDLSEIAETI